jgi:ATP/ADP translocase
VNHLPPRMVFYASVVPLVAFYAFFAGALYPASAYLHPHGFYERMAPLLPIGLHGLLKVGMSCASGQSLRVQPFRAALEA